MAYTPVADAPNLSRLWADALVEELVRVGVDRFFLAPGSRSTPLTTAVAANPRAHAVLHVDERGTAFAALGCGRATGRPAVWITTSGTAVANGLPAVVEASVDGVPLLLLTADRPPELRDTGANQTIDQVKLFGGYVRWQFDLPAPSPAVEPAMLLTTVDQAVHRAAGAPAGPVHLNAMFREPLAPEQDDAGLHAARARLERWLSGGAPHTRYARPTTVPAGDDLDALADALAAHPRGLVVAGKTDRPGGEEAVLALADRLGWPVLPDVGSPLRLAGGRDGVATAYDLLLGAETFARAHQPAAVLHLGGRVTSKRLAQALSAARPAVYAVVRDDPFRLDPDHRVTHRMQGDVTATCRALAVRLPEAPRDAAWCRAWTDASARVRAAVDAALDEAGLSEPLVARTVTERLPEGHGLVLASSMPVRDADAFGRRHGAPVRVAANRGASGIDGTLATAAGFAVGLDAPATVLLGDLSMLHDLNSLALLRRLPQPVTVVVVNNDGGGIFHFLPIARHDDVFEPYFGTPHGLGFEAAGTLFGLPYRTAETAEAFAAAYDAATASGTSSILEVHTDRRENHALHRTLLARAQAAAGRG